MFRKKLETTYSQYCMKFYEYSSSIYEAMDEIINSEINFSIVTVSDKGDVGMKYFGGKYSFDDFIKIYDRIRLDIDTLVLEFQDQSGSIQISTDEKDIILLTENKEVDLNNLLKKKDIIMR